MHSAIIVFARLPVVGKVKTRLAAGVGQEAATDFYRACAAHTFREAVKVERADVSVHYSTAEDGASMTEWLSSLGLALPAVCQSDNPDLGMRMRAALQAALSAGYCKVLLVGTDIPGLSSAVMVAALEALGPHQLVLGPAYDGGFYLVGLSTLPSGLMEGITWSTGTVREEVRVQAMNLGVDIAADTALPKLRDIDTAEDLAEWLQDPSTARGGSLKRECCKAVKCRHQVL